MKENAGVGGSITAAIGRIDYAAQRVDLLWWRTQPLGEENSAGTFIRDLATSSTTKMPFSNLPIDITKQNQLLYPDSIYSLESNIKLKFTIDDEENLITGKASAISDDGDIILFKNGDSW